MHLIFNNFFDYQTVLEMLSSSPAFLVPKLLNPDELKLSFTLYYHGAGFIEYMNILCKPLNIYFTTEVGVI